MTVSLNYGFVFVTVSINCHYIVSILPLNYQKKDFPIGLLTNWQISNIISLEQLSTSLKVKHIS